MLGFVASLLGGAIAPLVDQVSVMSARLLRKAALFVVAGLCMVVVMISLTIAFGLWIATLAGPIAGVLAVGGIYLLVAVIAIIFGLRDGSNNKSEPAHDPKSAEATAEAEKAERKSGLDAQIDQFTLPILGFLNRFGLRREQLAVLAGASIAKKMGPLPLVGLAIVGGFLVGRMWRSWRALLTADSFASLLAAFQMFGLGEQQAGADDAPDDVAA